ncbi:hypothetical protein HYH02_005089 [Chlamydomonas schloesseri]|uniref:Fido domain-containing protein n=1 Tax=Chlamydomonas schloesseri TaxID=2026947 RepID=A0A836B787_9CHLO|nr:hypothetical protein HYH02_005089 [Chlamydomonas schloesseri]|eukprot:KAG2449555.1 hypothetical protein HYH02_005089 [Chlamydomonas schloesseri]
MTLDLLTCEAVKLMHKILMWGAEGVSAGEYRTLPAHSGTGTVYPEAEYIDGGMVAVLENFHRDLALVASGALDKHIMAARLFYEMIMLHPFQNGNGRLCRLLVTYALMKAGDPFPVCLSNGHKKSRQHFQQVLRHADAHVGDVTRLAAYILECRHHAWQNFNRNLHYLPGKGC